MRGIRTMIYVLLILALGIHLFGGCQQEIDAARVPALLRDRIAHLESYQLALSVSLANGVTHELRQWYKGPASLRTDVIQMDGQPLYSFLSQGGTLVSRSYVDGLAADLQVVAGNALYLGPLLISLWQAATDESFEKDQQTAAFHTEFHWHGLDGREHAGDLILDARSLYPRTLRLFVGELQFELSIKFGSITLNPRLDDAVFR